MQKPDAIRAISDPAERIAAANAAGEDARRLAATYAQITRDTVRDLRKTMSLAQVAALLGISRSRVQQLEK